MILAVTHVHFAKEKNGTARWEMRGLFGAILQETQSTRHSLRNVQKSVLSRLSRVVPNVKILAVTCAFRSKRGTVWREICGLFVAILQATQRTRYPLRNVQQCVAASAASLHPVT